MSVHFFVMYRITINVHLHPHYFQHFRVNAKRKETEHNYVASTIGYNYPITIKVVVLHLVLDGENVPATKVVLSPSSFSACHTKTNCDTYPNSLLYLYLTQLFIGSASIRV